MAHARPTHSPATHSFGLALRGYDRLAVDEHLAETEQQLAALSDEVTRLRSALAAAEGARVALDQGAEEVLRSADERAAAITELSRHDDVTSAELLDVTRAACTELLTAAQLEANRALDDARRQAATIAERARQEFAWQRRQVRKEQTLVDIRKEQIVRQIVTLSALAAKTASSTADGTAPVEQQVAV